MKRTAFTMIELVFVLVIIGILASIAIPKLANIQDDAQIASENAGISAIRTSLQALHGKIIINGSSDFNITITKEDGSQAICTVSADNTTNGYPNALSVSDDFATLTPTQSANDRTLALVLEPTSRKQWKTKADKTGIKIIGPATSSITDTSASLNTGGSWLYIPTSGSIVYKANIPF